MARRGVFLATFCAISLILASTARARVFYQTFSKFTGIQTTLAFDGNLVPAPDGKTYDISLTGPAEVVDAFRPTVTNNGPLTVLTIGMKPNTSIVVTEAVNYTVRFVPAVTFWYRMPQNTLQALSTTGSGAFEANGQVINSGVPAFTLSASGAALTSVVDFPSVPVSIKTAGSGPTLIEGSEVASASVASTGSGETFLGIATGPVNIALAGTGSAYIATGGSQTTRIGGTALGTGKVYYDGGTCAVRGAGFVNPCTLGQIAMPV